MGTGYSFTCSHCQYKISTGGPWEFYRDRRGFILPYGNPCSSSGEAEKAGVCGLLGKVYCPDCKETKEIILEEYTKPVDSAVAGRQKVGVLPGYQTPPTCPDCGSTVYLENLEGLVCPACREGKLAGGMEWRS